MKPRKIAWIGTARFPFAKSARFSSLNMLTLLHTLLNDTLTETVRGLQRTEGVETLICGTYGRVTAQML